jgi:fructose-bisphosphate aldolase class I
MTSPTTPPGPTPPSRPGAGPLADPWSLRPDPLETLASELAAPPRGLLAADESEPTIAKRFAPLGIPCTPATRQAYRELLFTTPDIEQWLSGIILVEETLHQTTQQGKRLGDLLRERGIAVGIKVDRGTTVLPGHDPETVSEGLDGLGPRLQSLRSQGVAFAKWRSTFCIAPGLPSRAACLANAHVLVRYAALCQQHGILPIIEPELLMEGGHDLAACAEATAAVLTTVFAVAREEGVPTRRLILKINMVLPGAAAADPSDAEAIADATIATLRHGVPADVPAIVFLSGGQPSAAAFVRLAAIERRAPGAWPLTFSFSRAIQDDVLATWRGDAAQREAAQQVLRQRLILASMARLGRSQPPA